MQTWSRGRVLACLGFLILLAFMLSADPFRPADALSHDSCPPGQSPRTVASLGDVLLDKGAPPFTRMVLSRIVLAPGETLDWAPTGYTAYYVESGVLQYTFQPGLAISWTPLCTSPDGRSSGSGDFHIDDEGMATLNQGQTLIADLVPIGPIANGGIAPLVMLQMTLVLPEIDPATGLPIVDPVAAGRLAARERKVRKQQCRAEARQSASTTPIAAAGPTTAAEDWPATPAVSTAGWEVDSRNRESRAPKACRNARS